jgi:hypothetical protein
MNAQPMGVFYYMSAEEYFAVDAMSQSAMKELARSPWHYKNRTHKPPTKSMISGTLLHGAALEPEFFSRRYIVTPDDAPRRPTAAQWGAKKPSEDSIKAMRWWTEFNESLAGREVVLAEDYENTQAQVAALMRTPELFDILERGKPEVSFFWVDKATGIYCKGRADLVAPTKDGRVVMLDLKTSQDESPAGFSRAVGAFAYHRQDAHYRAGFEAAGGGEVAAFVFGVVNAKPPFLAVPYYLSDQATSQGAEEVDELLALYARCRESNIWPAFGDGFQEVELPRYLQRSTEVEVSFGSYHRLAADDHPEVGSAQHRPAFECANDDHRF